MTAEYLFKERDMFGRRKERDPFEVYSEEREDMITDAESELEALDRQIEEKLIEIREESRERRFKIPRALRRK